MSKFGSKGQDLTFKIAHSMTTGKLIVFCNEFPKEKIGHLKADDGEGKYVACKAGPPFHEVFWSHVDDGSGLFCDVLCLIDELPQSQVSNLGPSIRTQEDVWCFQIKVGNALWVQAV